MPATTQHLLGQLADGRFPLRKLLGVSQNSAVFLTSEPVQPGDPAPDLAIKLIPEDPATSDLQLEHWRAAAALSHPGLLRIHHFGRCAIDGSQCLYIVSDRADEDLGQLLPRRTLTPDETSGMLAAVLPTLDFLHQSGFVHAAIKPSNIHATGDNVKLSADRIVPAGESASRFARSAEPDELSRPGLLHLQRSVVESHLAEPGAQRHSATPRGRPQHTQPADLGHSESEHRQHQLRPNHIGHGQPQYRSGGASRVLITGTLICELENHN